MIHLLVPAIPPLDVTGYGEVRERFERRLDRDFDRTLIDNHNDLLTRVRLGARIKSGPHWRGQVEFQYGSDLTYRNGSGSDTESRDLSLGFIETDRGGWTLGAGREKINLGQQRLIGSFEWNNVSRSFDVLRARSKQWDVFVGRVGLQNPYPEHARLAVAQHTSKQAGTTLYVFKHDDGVDIHTLDQSYVRTMSGIVFDAEGALQGGNVAGKTQRAWAIHLGATTAGKSRPKPFAVYDAASGGSSGDENRTFDNLYPTNHGKFGIADMAGWRNISHFALGLDYAVKKDLSARLAWHNLSLQDPRDAWYSAGGAPNKHGNGVLRDPTGASGRSLGNEYDLDLNFTANRSGFMAGVGVFQPGRFVRNLTGHTDQQLFGYMQYTLKF